MPINDDLPQPTIQVRQPRYVSKFRCIGPDCEDSCCQGATVVIDKRTSEKYSACDDRQLRVIFDKVIVPNPESKHDSTFAFVANSDYSCPFLDEQRLCMIQNKLGEGYLSRTCDTYPRAINTVDGVVRRTLYMSCPEAARLALLDPNSMELESIDSQPMRFGEFPSVDTSDSDFTDKPYPYLNQLQTFAISLIKNRDYQLWERLVILGMFVEQLDKMATQDFKTQIPEHIASYEQHIKDGLFRPALDGVPIRPEIQINFAISALEHRLTSYTMSERFMTCYQEFMDGIAYTSGSNTESTRLYVDAIKSYYVPFIQYNAHVFENYIINSILTTLFPLGAQRGIYIENRPIYENYLLLVINYSLIRSMLIGMAASRQDKFGPEDVIRLVQTYTKAIDHNPPFVKQLLASVKANGMDKMSIVAVLLRD